MFELLEQLHVNLSSKLFLIELFTKLLARLLVKLFAKFFVELFLAKLFSAELFSTWLFLLLFNSKRFLAKRTSERCYLHQPLFRPFS